MVMVGYGHQGEEAVNYVTMIIFCAMGEERRDKGSALFHISHLQFSKRKIR